MNTEDLITRANPVPHGSIQEPDAAQARAAVSQIATARAGLPARRLAGRSRFWRPMPSARSRLAIGGAVLAGVAAIVLTQILPGSPAGPGRPGHAARTELDALALAAAAQPAEHALGPGQYQYTDSTSLTEDDTYISAKIHFAVTYREHRQIWIAANGSGRLAETFRDPRFMSAQDRAGWIAAGRPSLRIGPSDQKFGPHGLSLGPRNLLRLPTNPARLRALLVARKIEGGPPGPAEDFVQIGDLLRETDAPPALRAAVFTVAKQIPGVRLLGTVTDHSGRPGLGIAYVSHFAPTRGRDGQRAESVLIFDPKTSKLTAEETYLTDDKTKKTTLVAWTVYLVSGVVDSITSTTPVAGSSGNGSGPA